MQVPVAFQMFYLFPFEQVPRKSFANFYHRHLHMRVRHTGVSDLAIDLANVMGFEPCKTRNFWQAAYLFLNFLYVPVRKGGANSKEALTFRFPTAD